MKGKDADVDRLTHIWENIHDIEYGIIGLSEDTFYSLGLEKLGVVKAIENIGEAANHVSEDTRNLAPDINWSEIVGMRNKLIHEYFRINYRIVYEVATIDIMKLKEQISNLKSQLES